MMLNGKQLCLLGVSFLVLPLSLAAQNDPTMPVVPGPGNVPSSNQTTPGVTPGRGAGQDPSQSNAGGADAQTMKDKMFLRKATQGSAAEIQLGQLAAQRGGSPEVKAFGQKMVQDHTALNDSLRPFADELGVMQPKPNKMDQMEFEKLSSLSGPEFDKEYLAYMVHDHHKDLREFQEEAASAAEPGLKDAVAAGERVIARHTRMADKLAAANGVPPEPPK